MPQYKLLCVILIVAFMASLLYFVGVVGGGATPPLVAPGLGGGAGGEDVALSVADGGGVERLEASQISAEPGMGNPRIDESDLEGGVRIVGSVRYASTGLPMTGVAVSASLYRDGTVVGGGELTLVTDRAGAYVITLPVGPEVQGQVVLDCPGYSGLPVYVGRIAGIGVFEIADILAFPAYGVQGRASARSGRGAPLVKIQARRIVEERPLDGWGDTVIGRDVVTDAGGYFAIRDLPAGLWSVSAYSDDLTLSESLIVLVDRHVDDVDLVLDERPTIEGAVRFVDGVEPRPVRLIATSQGYVGSQWRSEWGKVAADGTFLLRATPGVHEGQSTILTLDTIDSDLVITSDAAVWGERGVLAEISFARDLLIRSSARDIGADTGTFSAAVGFVGGGWLSFTGIKWVNGVARISLMGRVPERVLIWLDAAVESPEIVLESSAKGEDVFVATVGGGDGFTLDDSFMGDTGPMGDVQGSLFLAIGGDGGMVVAGAPVIRPNSEARAWGGREAIALVGLDAGVGGRLPWTLSTKLEGGVFVCRGGEYVVAAYLLEDWVDGRVEEFDGGGRVDVGLSGYAVKGVSVRLLLKSGGGVGLPVKGGRLIKGDEVVHFDAVPPGVWSVAIMDRGVAVVVREIDVRDGGIYAVEAPASEIYSVGGPIGSAVLNGDSESGVVLLRGRGGLDSDPRPLRVQAGSVFLPPLLKGLYTLEGARRSVDIEARPGFEVELPIGGEDL